MLRVDEMIKVIGFVKPLFADEGCLTPLIKGSTPLTDGGEGTRAKFNNGIGCSRVVSTLNTTFVSPV